MGVLCSNSDQNQAADQLPNARKVNINDLNSGMQAYSMYSERSE